jgi:hypothetical protein
MVACQEMPVLWSTGWGCKGHVTARRPGTGNELRPRLTAGEKQFGLRDSSDSILVHQLPGVGCRPRSRLVPPQAQLWRACPSIPCRRRGGRLAGLDRGDQHQRIRRLQGAGGQDQTGHGHPRRRPFIRSTGRERLPGTQLALAFRDAIDRLAAQVFGPWSSAGIVH